jgi:hypothetical protein
MSSATRDAFSSVVADSPSTTIALSGTPDAIADRFMICAEATDSGSLEPPEKIKTGA